MSKEQFVQKAGFKHTPIGWIPEEWEVVKIKDIATITSGTTPLRSEAKFHTSGTISWVKTTDLNNSIISETEEKVTEVALKETSLRLYPKDTVLVAMYGGFNQIGRTGILSIDAAINQALSALKVSLEKIHPMFLLYWLNAKVGLWKALAGSSRKDPNITSKDVGDFPVIQIPLPEQIIITDFLTTWKKAIDKTTQLIAQKELRKKWLMQQLLTGKKRLPGFAGEWKEVRLGDVFEFIKSYSISRDGLVVDVSEDTVYCIHYGDIHTKYGTEFLDFSVQQKIPVIKSETIVVEEKNLLKEGDIIMADASEDHEGVGEAVEIINLGDKLAVGGLHTIVVRDVNGVTSNGFRAYLFTSSTVRNQLRRKATGTSVYSVTKTNLGNLTLLLPPIDEQTAIAEVLQAAGKEVQLLKDKLAQLKEQKKGLMQVLLTGKKRMKL